MNVIKTTAAIFLVALSILIALLYINKPSLPKEELKVKRVTIYEGLSAVEISQLLKDEGIFANGEILPQELDGYLFPDTYEFYVPSSLEFVVSKMSDNFNRKVLALVPDDKNVHEVLTVASMVEEEVINDEDRRIVAGIIWKRLQAGMRLQVDATMCYIKTAPCFPITKRDLAIDSHYNTYLYEGLPPGPISNPGLASIKSSLNPQKSDFWFYISDPKTKKTIFSKTLDEHNRNVAVYLR